MSNKVVFLSLVLLISVSCQKDSVPEAGKGDTSIVCSVSVSGAYDTKSKELDWDALSQDGNTFKMDAWLEKENRGKAWPEFDAKPHYIEGATMKYDPSKGVNSKGAWLPLDTDTTVVWTNGIWTNFWAQYPETLSGRGDLIWTAAVTDSITDIEERKPSFTYDMSAYTVAYPNTENEKWNADYETPDFLVAYAREMYTFDDGLAQEKLVFKFGHALSAVKFTPELVPQGNSVDSILISGVYSSGTCHLEGLPREASNNRDSVIFDWKKEKLQKMLSDDRGYGTTYPMDTLTYIFMIPQELLSTAVLQIHLGYDPGRGGVKENSKWYNASLEGFTWKPGYIYNYQLNFDKDKHSIVVTVDESCAYKYGDGKWD